jgi:carboxyl-terminal processing protease
MKNINITLLFAFAATCYGHETKISSTKKEKPELNSTEQIYKWLKTTSEVVSIVEEKSFRNVDFSQFMQEALKAAVSSVDAHSAFIKNYEEISDSTSGKFSGIGVSIISKATEDDSMIIVDVLEDSPSQKAGLLAGDKIVAVEDEKLRGLSSDEVIHKMKGKRGTKVRLKIIRNKKPLEFTVERDIIKDQSSVCYHFPEQEVYYFGLKVFSENSTGQMRKLLEKAKKDKNCNGIVLDLRSNPGGVLEVGVEMAGLFLPKGSLVVSTRDNKGKPVKSYSTKKDPVFDKSLPIFVLINNFTASASEILAGAMGYHSSKSNDDKDQKSPMVFIVGTESFGKGSVQEVIPVSNGGALKMTTMLYFLPDGNSIQDIGVKPDILVKPKSTPSKEMKWIHELYGKEKSIKHHITAQEAEKVGKGEKPELASKVDEREEKRKRELEIRKEKEDEAIDKDPLKDADDPDGKLSFQEKQERDIGSNSQIQACVNMITMLNFAKEQKPDSVSSKKKALTFLKKHYLTDEEVKVKKLKE